MTPDERDREAEREAEREWVRVTRAVPLTAIAEQIEKGWPDFHPEDFCHRCGHRNLSWFVASSLWNEAWEQVEPGIQSVLCPACFVELWEKSTGLRITWELRPDVATLRAQLRRAAEGRPWREYPV